MATLLDTNCLLRYLLADNADQFASVSNCVKKGACTSPEFVSECVYVLSGPVYGFDRKEVADAMAALLEDVDCEHEASMRCAIDLYRDTTLDFPDCILAARHAVEGIEVMTFDKKLNKLIDRME